MTDKVQLVQICAKCSGDLPPDANFCPACGTAVSATKEVEEPIASTLKEFAAGTADQIKRTSREALKSDLGKKVAAGAAIGAVAAAAIPLVTWGAGALVGGGYVLYRRLTK